MPPAAHVPSPDAKCATKGAPTLLQEEAGIAGNMHSANGSERLRPSGRSVVQAERIGEGRR